MTRKDDIALLQAYTEASAAALAVLRIHAEASPHIKLLQDSVRREEKLCADYAEQAQEHIRIQRETGRQS